MGIFLLGNMEFIFMRKITHIIIHHTATDRDKTTFQAVKDYHINKGWSDIGYNWLITADGVLHEGRPQNIIGAHTRDDGMNYKSLGIALTGNFEKEQPTEKQLETLRGIINQVRDIYKIPAENVLGHKEVRGAATACPGTYLMTFIKTLRKVNNSSSEVQEALSETIKEQRQEIGRLKQNNDKLTRKLTNAKELIKELKVALQSKKSWVDKLLEVIKKNENDS